MVIEGIRPQFHLLERYINKTVHTGKLYLDRFYDYTTINIYAVNYKMNNRADGLC